MISQFKHLLSKIVELENRLRAIEAFNQVRDLLIKGDLTISEGGVFTIKDSSGNTIFKFDPTTQKLDIYDSSGNTIIEFDTSNQTALIVGDTDVKGNLDVTEGGIFSIKNSSGNTIFKFDPTTQKLNIYDNSGDTIIEFDTTSQTANIGGDSNVKIDGTNKRIIINDGTNDRVLIGYQSGGF